jgi:hypothetical protein
MIQDDDCATGNPMKKDLKRRARVWLAGALAASLVGASSLGSAGDLTRFELDDGSVVLGEALGLANGVYRIRTPALGDIDVEASRIRSMARAEDHAPDRAAGGADYSAEIEGIQRQIAGNSDMMQSIMALQGDPEIQRALQDPELMGLILSGDAGALRDHPGMKRLMEHPGIRGILEQLVGSQGGLR